MNEKREKITISIPLEGLNIVKEEIITIPLSELKRLKCPKCGHRLVKSENELLECPNCGIMVMARPPLV